MTRGVSDAGGGQKFGGTKNAPGRNIDLVLQGDALPAGQGVSTPSVVPQPSSMLGAGSSWQGG